MANLNNQADLYQAQPVEASIDLSPKRVKVYKCVDCGKVGPGGLSDSSFLVLQVRILPEKAPHATTRRDGKSNCSS